MDSKHTPGPWMVSTDDNGPTFLRVVGTGMHNGEIAKVAKRERYSCAAEESVANARLIAAAPELLTALRELLRQRDQDTHGPCHVIPFRGCVGCAARAAIAKAEGK